MEISGSVQGGISEGIKQRELEQEKDMFDGVLWQRDEGLYSWRE